MSDSCSRKIRYQSEKSARRYGDFKHRTGKSPELRAYHCPDCQGWHLTKQLEER